MPKFRLPIAFLMLAIAVLALPLVAIADNQWGKYSWPTDGGPALSLGDNLNTDTWVNALAIANVDWNASDFINNTVDPGRTNAIDCSPETGQVEICNSQYGDTGWLGVAGIWIAKGKQITKGYVKVNDTYFDAAPGTYLTDYNTPPWRQLVMCQEVGHIFGLAHQDEDFNNGNLDTCMDYTSDPASNQHPNQHDIDQLAAMYGTSDGGDDGDDGDKKGSGPPAGKGKPSSPPGNDISQWGKAISTDGKGRPDLFELDLGRGNKLFTHVLWAN